MITERLRWTTLLVPLALAGYLPSAITSRPPAHRILIPLDQPIDVEPPMQVDVVTPDGTRGLRIPPNVGRGWAGEAGGKAAYRFHIPQTARYTPWMYCLWQDPCSNAVFVRFNDTDPFILGNDPVYHEWHWVRGPAFELIRGTHTLTLANHSDHIALGRMMLLSDPADRPDGLADAIYDLFYDGFDGCDGGHIAMWRLDTPGWELAQPLGEDRYDVRVLHGQGPQTGPASTHGPYVVVGDAHWRNIALTVSTKVRRAGPFAFCFDFEGPHAHLAVRWQPGTSDKAADAVEVWRVTPDAEHLLGRTAVSIAPDRWHELAVLTDNSHLALKVDGRMIGPIAVSAPLNGPIALHVGPGADIWFDDVHVRRRANESKSWASDASGKQGLHCGTKGRTSR